MNNSTMTRNDRSDISSVILNNESTMINQTDVHFVCQLRLTTMNIILIVCFTIIFTLSVIGNCLVIVTIAQNRWMRSVTNMFLQSLAISDLLLSVICMPPTLTAMLFHCFLWGRAMCKLFTYLQPVSVAASAYTLVAIALERYNAICRPLHSRHWKTKSHAMKVIVAVWVISLLSSSPSLFVYDLYQIQPGQWNCRDDWGAMKDLSGFYYLFLVLMLFVVPLALMVALYSVVTYTLWRGMKMDSTPIMGEMSSPSDEHGSVRFPVTASIRQRVVSSKPAVILRRFGESIRSRASTSSSMIFGRSSRKTTYAVNDGSIRFAPNNGDDLLAGNSAHSKLSSSIYGISSSGSNNGPILRSTHSAKNLEAKKRVIIMLFAIVAEFLICWSPMYLYRAMYYLGWVRVDPYVYTFFVVLAYLSSCSNPITYCFLNLKFRQAFLLAFGCRFMIKDTTLCYQNTGVLGRQQHLPSRRFPPVANGHTKEDGPNEQQRVIDNVVVQCHQPLGVPLVQLRTPSIRSSSEQANDQMYNSDEEDDRDRENLEKLSSL